MYLLRESNYMTYSVAPRQLKIRFSLHPNKWEKQEEIWLRQMTKAPTPSPYPDIKIQKATWQHKNATKNFDYTTIADRIRTVSWGNNSP